MADRFSTVDEYIGSFPPEVQDLLAAIRRTIHANVPGAEETIKYQMPTITVDGKSLVHFAAWRSHIGLYPLPKGDEVFQRQLAPYDTGKGTARFPFRQRMPLDLIGRIAALLLEARGTTAVSQDDRTTSRPREDRSDGDVLGGLSSP